jgi:hypothetical protein
MKPVETSISLLGRFGKAELKDGSTGIHGDNIIGGNGSVGGADEIGGDGEQGGIERSKLGGEAAEKGGVERSSLKMAALMEGISP